MRVPLRVGIKILFKFYLIDKFTGKSRCVSGWCGNTLLTSGRNNLASLAWFTNCVVGTDNTAPAAGQTALLGYVASNTSLEETVVSAQASSPFYGWKRKRFRFDSNSGIANENLNEVAISWATGSGDVCTNRALIVDISGIPVTISPLADEILDVVVEVRYYPPLSDATGTVVLDGLTYDYILRAAVVTSTSAWGDNIGSKIVSLSADPSHWKAYDDDIGTIEQYPNGVGTNSASTNDFTNAYINNSYQIVFGMASGPTGWNVLTGKLLRSLQFFTTAGHYQIQFDSQSSPGNGIPKTSAEVLTFQFVLNWEEEIIP